MGDTTLRLEELSYRTLPSVDTERYDGWVLRWSGPGSRRANSVNPIRPGSLPLSEKIAYCEAWYASRRAPAIFRLTELADAALDGALAEAGYARTAPTNVMTATIGEAEPAADVAISATPSDQWLRSIPGLGDADDARLDALRHQLTNSGGRNDFAAVTLEGRIAAIGVGIHLDGYTTIYNMNTVAHARRKGLAGNVLSTLLASGLAAGSTHAVLQVTEENTPAQNLYRKAGFDVAYKYFYREKPSPN